MNRQCTGVALALASGVKLGVGVNEGDGATLIELVSELVVLDVTVLVTVRETVAVIVGVAVAVGVAVETAVALAVSDGVGAGSGHSTMNGQALPQEVSLTIDSCSISMPQSSAPPESLGSPAVFHATVRLSAGVPSIKNQAPAGSEYVLPPLSWYSPIQGVVETLLLQALTAAETTCTFSWLSRTASWPPNAMASDLAAAQGLRARRSSYAYAVPA